MTLATATEPRAATPAPLVSDWILVDQERIDRFAEATGDHQFIHVDPVRAAATPFGGTIAHGLLTLSLLPGLADATLPGAEPEAGTTRISVNYGYDRIRFVAPVRSGKRIRAHFTLAESVERAPGQRQRIMDVSVEIEGEAKPALVARSISLTYGG